MVAVVAGAFTTSKRICRSFLTKEQAGGIIHTNFQCEVMMRTPSKVNGFQRTEAIGCKPLNPLNLDDPLGTVTGNSGVSI